MKNLLKISILFLLFALMFFPCVNTFAINMDLDSDTNTAVNSSTDTIVDESNNSINEDLFEENSEDPTEDPFAEEETTINTNSPTVTSTSSNDDGFLTIENILSIIIIVIGIILIFLAIAILIRCK
ncbi:MAG: hypothetical protein IJB90_05835 [Clostridia bacterium]|nr:hypothetical protein [Clostridia bacterium]